MSNTKELAKNEPMVTQAVPDYLKTNEGSRGSEAVTQDDIIIPRLEIVQGLSPERDKAEGTRYIEGAEEGMLFNTVTRQLYSGTLLFCPSVFVREYLIFRSRVNGGGFRGAFPTYDIAKRELDSFEDSNICSVVEVAQHFGILVGAESMEEICIAMSRSKIKVSRQFNTLVRIAGGDRFSRAYEIKSVPDKSDKGSYYNFSIKSAGYPSEKVYRRAERVYELVTSGLASVNHDEQGSAGNVKADKDSEM